MWQNGKQLKALVLDRFGHIFSRPHLSHLVGRVSLELAFYKSSLDIHSISFKVH